MVIAITKDGLKTHTPELGVKTKKRTIDSLTDVFEAVLMQIIGIIHKNDLPLCYQLYALLSIAITINRQHQWPIAYQYVEAVRSRYCDIQERIKAGYAADISFSMAVIHDDLLNMAIRATSSPAYRQKETTKSGIQRQVCFQWNKGKCRFKDECRRRHVCERCHSEDHRGAECPAASKLDSNSATTASNKRVGNKATENSAKGRKVNQAKDSDE